MIELPPINPLSMQAFFSEHRDVVHSYIIREILKALKEKRDVVELFHFYGGETATARRQDYTLLLGQALEYFVSHELFEEAAFCRDIITKVKCDDVIHNS